MSSHAAENTERAPLNDDETATTDHEDIGLLIEECAASLSVSVPFLADENTFNLYDAMAATQLMDRKMDSCEVPASLVSPIDTVDENDDRMVFPRPVPLSLDDTFTPLPWNELAFEDVAIIAVQILIRVQSLFTGASVAESAFTCLYAHSPVLGDMMVKLFPESIEDRMSSLDIKVTKDLPKIALFASVLSMVNLTDLFRGIVFNADIYEEEDFVSNTNDIPIFTEGKDIDAREYVNFALKALQSSDDGGSYVQLIRSTLSVHFALMSVLQTLAKLTAEAIPATISSMLDVLGSLEKGLDDTMVLLEELPPENSDIFLALLRRVFDPFVNRPSLGNAPVRRVRTTPPTDALRDISTIAKDLSRFTCRLLLRGSSLQRILRMLDQISRKDVNIISRSLIVLNLYFDEKVLGQYPLAKLITDHMNQQMAMPAKLLDNEYTKIFLERIQKPYYDYLKLRVLNRNRQRSYIEAAMIPDWNVLQNEAHIVDVRYRQENGLDNKLPPYLSQYVLVIIIRLMDRHLSSGIELKLFHGHQELSFAFWYRDFLLSALFNQLTLMKQVKDSTTKRSDKPTRAGKKNRKGKNESAVATKTQEDMEDEFELVVVAFKRMLCRGLVRFIAALRQVGLLLDQEFEFTSHECIFEQRFDLFQTIRQPPPLSYDDYLEGSNFSKVSREDLVRSTAEWFQSCKSTADQLLASVGTIDADYAPMDKDEIQSLVKVCVGNQIYARKLQQVVATPNDKLPRVVFDFSEHDEFCIIKLS